MIGKILGNCRILKKLGEGGMGSVYLARDLTLEREVAVKVIAPELARRPGLMARFRVEAIAQAKLNHTNIVTIHSFDQEKDIYYIVMEHVDGKTLKDVIKETGKLQVGQALQIFLQILAGMAYAHSKGVVHRDIKPSNIFLTTHQTAKIGDFGIAKVEGIDGLTRVGTTLGSPVYSSPEQLLGKETDARSDVYSLGISLYEMLIGDLPFKTATGSDYELMKKTVEAAPPKPSAFNPAIPASLDALVMKSIAKNPDQRFQSVKEFKDAVRQLAAALTPEPAPSGHPVSAKPGEKIKKAFGTKWPANKKYLAIAAALAVIVIIAAAVLISTGSPAPHVQSGSTGGDTQQVNHLPRGKSAQEMPRIVLPDEPKKSTQPKDIEPEPYKSGDVPKISGIDSAAEIVKKMNWHINNGHYRKALAVGERALKEGAASPDIYFKIAHAYYCDGNRDKARLYYLKTLEQGQNIRFSVGYQYDKDSTINGTLAISSKNLYFIPNKESLNSYRFSVPMSQVKRVSLDRIADIKGLFKKKKNRENPRLVIRDKKKNKYTLEVKTRDTDNNKMRSFIKDIIITLRKG